MATTQEVNPFLKATLPARVLKPSRTKSSPTRFKVLPLRHGAGPHASCELPQDRRSQTAARAERVTA
jgi:hypothetical protein